MQEEIPNNITINNAVIPPKVPPKISCNVVDDVDDPDVKAVGNIYTSMETQ